MRVRNSHPFPFPRDWMPMPEVLMTTDEEDNLFSLGTTDVATHSHRQSRHPGRSRGSRIR